MALRLSSEILEIETAYPFGIARGTVQKYRRVWVRLIDDDGVAGWGEADPSYYYGETADTVVAALTSYATALPSDPFDLEAAHIYKIAGGKIHEIEAMGFTLPLFSKNGWSPFSK